MEYIHSLKDNNKFSIIRCLILYGPMSRTKLQQHIKLSNMTISNLVKEMINDGIISELPLDDNEPSVGRKVKNISSIENARFILGVCIEHANLTIGILNLSGKILRSTSCSIYGIKNVDMFIRRILIMTDYILGDDYADKICVAGISSIGPLNHNTGELLDPLHINNGKPIDIVDVLSDHLHIPVCLDNDCNVAALAELYYGRGSRFDNFVYLNIKSGIGAGIVLNGKLYRGCYGFGGEIGHLIFTEKEIDSSRQSVYFEDYCSTNAILKKYCEKVGYDSNYSSDTWWEFINGILSKDSDCLEILNQTIDSLAAGLTAIVNILDSKCIFLGGCAGPLISIMIPRLKEEIQKRRFSKLCDIILEKSEFFSNASFSGISALAIENLWQEIYMKRRNDNEI